MKKPIGFLNEELDETAENENKQLKEQSDRELLKAFLIKTFSPIEQLKGDVIIDTNDVFDLAFASGFNTTKKLINELLLEIGFKKFDISGVIEKVWLIEENIETQ